MDEAISKIINQIFNNWTALRLAVEHSLGGPNSLQIAREAKDYMIQFCLCNKNIESEDIQDALDDIMDEEFQTLCEDNSTKEISIILHRFLQLLKDNNLTQCEVEFNNLPKASSDWLNLPCVPCNPTLEKEDSDDDSEEESNVTPMEEDSEWTTVKPRKKR